MHGARITFPKVSVGATHNVLLAAALAKGETLIENAAREPEIGDVAMCLGKMGVEIEGIGTSTLRIQGRDRLEGAIHTVLPDRIETGTFAFAVAATGGDVLLEGARSDLLRRRTRYASTTGVEVIEKPTALRVRRNGRRHCAGHGRDPALPRLPDRPPGADDGADDARQRHQRHPRDDLRKPLHARPGAGAPRRRHLSCTATPRRLPASMPLRGAPVMATDLRASVSLVIAGLMAEGETMINRVYHLDRGFERLEEKLSSCGARIERISGE